jgi:hypothetical protein
MFDNAGVPVQDTEATVLDLSRADRAPGDLASSDRSQQDLGPATDALPEAAPPPDGPVGIEAAPPSDSSADQVSPDLPPLDIGLPDVGQPDTAQPDIGTVDPLAPFGTPQKVPGINTSASEDDPTLTGDMLEIYFDRDGDIYVATRSSVTDAWGTAQLVTELSTADAESNPEVLPDGLTIFISSDRPHAAALGVHDIYVATRSARGQSWGAPLPVTELNTAYTDTPGPGPDNVTMIVSTDRPGTLGGQDLYLSTRASATVLWSAPTQIAGVNSATSEWSPWITAGATVVYFAGSNGTPSQDLWVTTRSSPTASFFAPVLVGGVNTGESESDPWLSADLRTLYFSRYENNQWEIYVAQR